jgi:hypothetical protein
MFRWLWRRRRIDEDTRAEIESHLDLLTDRYMRAGMSRDDARAAAARQFGNVTWHREEIHAMNGIRLWDELAQDLRYALKQIRHSAGFASAIVAILALGIGGMTAVVSVARAVLLAPLPYDRPHQLVRIYQQESGDAASRAASMSAPRFTAIREAARRRPASICTATGRPSGFGFCASPATTSARCARRRSADPGSRSMTKAARAASC